MPNFPMNEDSEVEGNYEQETRFPAAASYVPQNSESESESPYTPEVRAELEGTPAIARGRQGPKFASTTTGYDSGDEGPLPTKPYTRTRSRTPRGATSRSRSRARTALPINSESEDGAALSGGDQPLAATERTSKIPLNEGSDTDSDVAPPLQTFDRAGRHSARKTARTSRSRSRGRVPVVEAP